MVDSLKILGRMTIGSLGLLVLTYIGVSVVMWFGPSGMGESKSSPDRRFVAHAFNMRQNRLFQEPLDYIQLTLTDPAVGPIWKIDYRVDTSSSLPYKPTDFTIREVASQVHWAADSRSVQFPLGSGRTMTVSVP
jgi:hypothetical protein